MGDIAAVNDAAYGLEGGLVGRARSVPAGARIRPMMALLDGKPVSCAIVLDYGDDACVSAVATVPEHAGGGAWPAGSSPSCSRLPGARGLRTGSLQASRAGAPVYERLGFADVGFIEMWERRTG